MPNANFMKQSQIYSKLKDKRYHTNDNFKPSVLHYSNFSVDVNQIREIENFLFNNSDKKAFDNNRQLINRWLKRRSYNK